MGKEPKAQRKLVIGGVECKCVSLNLPLDTFNALEAAAAADGRKFSILAGRILDKHFGTGSAAKKTARRVAA